MLKFEWDEEKDWSNFLKHGIFFEEAKLIWTDENATEYFDSEHSLNEERFIRKGYHPEVGVLIVVFCERGESIRIISARKADKFGKGTL